MSGSVCIRLMLSAAAVCASAGCIETVATDLTGGGTSTAPAATMLDASMVTHRGAITFVKGWELGRQISGERGRPCLVFYTANWCTYCRKMEETTFVDPAVAQLASRFVCILVDADAETAVCQRQQISGYPTLEIVSPAGGSLGRLTGWQTAPALAQSLQWALERYATLELPLRK